MERLKSDLKLKTPGNFYVFFGPEAYLREYYLQALRKLVVEEATEAFNYHRFNRENISVQAVMDSLEALPMMAPRSMIRIDDVNFFGLEEGADYAALFSDIPDYCTLVLVYDTVEFKVDKRKKALAAAFEKAVAAEFTRPSERELTGWILRHFRKHKKTISPELCQYLIGRTGGSMTALSGEIEKLAAFAPGEEITRREIDELVEPVLEAEAFDLSDAIASGRYERAMERLDALLQKQEEPVRILGAVGSQMRRILTAKRLSDAGRTAGDLASLCGVSGYAAQKTMEFARRLPEDFCARAVELCLEADVKMKTSYDDPERILELLIPALAEEARRG